MRIELGTKVQCLDGGDWEVGDVVIDPRRRTVTHLVVEPQHQHGLARLVPVEEIDTDADEAGDDVVRLRCSVAELRHYPEINESAFVRLGEWPPTVDGREIGVLSVLAMPFYDSAEPGSIYMPTTESGKMLVSFDHIPEDEVEIEKGSEVEAEDGSVVGTVDGFLVDANRRISHLVLERGHWWAKREIRVPVDAISRFHNDRIQLDIDAEALDTLPSSRIGHRRHRSLA